MWFCSLRLFVIAAGLSVRLVSAQCTVTSLAGGNTTGRVSGYIDGVGTAALFANPQDVAVAKSGTVFVADAFNHKIRAISPNGTVSTLAGGSTTGTSSGFTNGIGSAALFEFPYGVAVGSMGIVYVTDHGNHKIRAIAPNGAVTTLAGGSTTGSLSGSINGIL